ncbi:uncharacterized protein B0H18DRAFT_972851 [Fomitopsis serialis]|uniref:uncharacterized protein n=1 Tax=Fomitopsis serialis TaxID=139415 RepID=UPI002008C09F|nr:uncharacterized protein B0H18DRAFT_972851 [Neoantrodia serialis]KAH9936217.1 hypothetical protein B0H18DRAFT_972851 [Neoantrodia serialis]
MDSAPDVIPEDRGMDVVPTEDACPPFDRSTADVILRSSDLVDFRVRKAILAEASPVFEGMFSLPQPSGPTSGGPPSDPPGTSANGTEFKDGLPVVVLQENGDILDRLLRICYPVPPPPLRGIDFLSPILAAAVKYAMDGVTLVLRKNLCDFLQDGPLRAYCLAIHYGFAEEAEQAAKATLRIDRRILFRSIPCAPELEMIDGKMTLLLLDYHQRCSDALLHLKRRVPFLTRDWIWFKCDVDQDECPLGEHSVKLMDGSRETPTKWWRDYLVSMVDIMKDAPSSDAIRRDTRLFDKAIKEALECETCADYAQSHMRKFVGWLADYVDGKVSQVKLSLPANVRKSAALSAE